MENINFTDPETLLPITANGKGNFQCGKCYQEVEINKGRDMGETIPEHFRTCPKRTN